MASRHPLPYAFAKANTLLLEDDGAQRVLWAADNSSASALSEVVRLFDVTSFEREAAGTLAQRIAVAYAGGESSAAAVVGEVESAVDLSRLMQELPAVEDLLEAADDAPIIRMLNALLTQAAKDGASDIHIEPYERTLAVRFRVDGTLREVVQPNKALHAALISRLKIMAELDIAEKRLPQDGRISLRIGGRAVDVRVSTLPPAHGERAVLRLLDKTEANFSLEGLGMSGEVLTRFDHLIEQPHGIVLVTGPTGSGKTTTLYASLARLPTGTTNILTVEDPIEYELRRHRPDAGQPEDRPHVRQGAARDPAPGPGRHHDRRDPRLRDGADRHPGLAHRPPGAGHRCTPTTRPRAVTRLIDMGVEPFLLSSSLLGVLAQRLVRKLCVHCRRQDDAGRWHPVGCARMRADRLQGPHRCVRADERRRQAARADPQPRRPRPICSERRTAHGMRSMRDDGERLVDEGITSLEEVLRVTRGLR